jgi:serine/threonine-protein kinase
MILDEARLIASIHHPNVVQVFELLAEDPPAIVMEYLDGDTLAGLTDRLRAANRRLPPELGALVVSQACLGVHAAHELEDALGRPREVIHRDLSPNNFFITRAGEVKVLDFGVARYRDRLMQTQDDTVIRGTYAYMSPEQSLGKPLDRRSDLFSLGVVLWECVTGMRLFARENPLATARAIAEDVVLPPSQVAEVDPRFDAVCRKALSRAPEQRFQTAQELVEALAPLLGAGGTEALAALTSQMVPRREIPEPAKAAADRPSLAQPRRRAAFAAVAVLAVTTAGAFVFWPRARPVAQAPTPPPTPAPVAAAPEPAVAEVAPPPPPEPEPSVQLKVVTVPPGAAVWIDGRPAGTAPITAEVPRATTPLTIEARKPGYQPAQARAVPLNPLSMTLTLERPRRAAAKPPKADPLHTKW